VLPGADLPPPGTADQSTETRRSLRIDPAAMVAIQVGRPSAFKGTGRAVAAVRVARERGVDAHLVLVGAPPDPAWLGAMIRQEGGENWTHVVGEVDEYRKFELLAAADALFLVSDYEAFGFVALEALASGTPVLAFEDLPAAPTLASVGAILTPRASAEALAVAFLLAGKEQRPPMPPRTWDEYGDEMTRLIEEVMADGTPPGAGIR
jgi:glycosyltransferase involved in cell wall biosynthesis